MGPTPEIQEFLKAIASETRQRILFLFVDLQERTVSQVASQVGLGQSTASEHLTILKQAGLMVARRDGKEVYYAPDRQHILAMLKQLTDVVSCCFPVSP